MGNPRLRTTRTIAVLAIALAAAIPAKPQAPKLAFSGAREDYPYNGSFALGDFNGDGFPDIATSDSSYMVVILVNDGTGHYTQSAAIPGSPGGYFVAGDFNNDGLLDVAFTAYNGVYIALGKGDGTLQNLSEVAGGGGGDIVAVDLNGDGKLDVIVGGYNVSYFLGYGDGTLQSPVTFPSFSSPFAVTDVNGDKKPDILGVAQGTLEVELNNGNGTFTLGPKTTL